MKEKAIIIILIIAVILFGILSYINIKNLEIISQNFENTEVTTNISK